MPHKPNDVGLIPTKVPKRVMWLFLKSQNHGVVFLS